MEARGEEVAFRTRTGTSPSQANASTVGPICRTTGARMNTAGISPSPLAETRASNESTWRPVAFRSTATSRRARNVSGQFVIRRARRIIPAQVPNVGSPARISFRRASARPVALMSRHIAVDSPPGRMIPVSLANCSGRSTGHPATPRRARVRKCSRTSPWTARTPTVIGVASAPARGSPRSGSRASLPPGPSKPPPGLRDRRSSCRRGRSPSPSSPGLRS